MSAPTSGAQSGHMFTSDAVQQLAADHRRTMMAEARSARTINAASVAGRSRGHRLGRSTAIGASRHLS